MGNVIGTSTTQRDIANPTEEWLHDLITNKSLDFSRKVSHNQFLKHIQGVYSEASLTDLPWSILETTNLQTRVDGSFNNISQINSNIALRIPHLTHVNLSYNTLTEIPNSIALLFHLEELLLRDNKLTSLPEEMCLLPKLQMVDVSFNSLHSLPRGIGKLKNLARLNVSHNYLTHIPHSLGHCTHLYVLLASHNQCVNPPQDLCNSSSKLLMFLKANAPEVLPFKKLNLFPRIRSNIARSQLEVTPRAQSMSTYVQTLTQTTMPSSRALTPLLLPPHATRCSQDDLRDKIIGLLFGAILGDTLGVATEFLEKDDIEFYYGMGRLDHANILQDEHRSHFQRGKTTCVSDFMFVVFNSMLDWCGVLDELDIAHRLKDLKSNSQSFITSTVINRLLAHEGFCRDPHSTALDTARQLKEVVCEDLYALPMAIISGLPQFYNLSEVQSNAIRVCQTTHNHERVVKASSLLASIVALILQGYEANEIRQVMGVLDTSGVDTIKDELDRVMDAAFDCVNCETNFESTLTKVLFQGRESRIYGAVCGGISGCISGYTRLPARWLGGLHPSLVSMINDRLNHFLDMMGLP